MNVFADGGTARKPIDPPPIVQLKVNGDRHRFVSSAPPSRIRSYAYHGDNSNWLVNPFLFMNAVLVSAENEHGQPSVPKTLQGNQLLGQNVSSLHRLKDINNKGKRLSRRVPCMIADC